MTARVEELPFTNEIKLALFSLIGGTKFTELEFVVSLVAPEAQIQLNADVMLSPLSRTIAILSSTVPD